MTVTPTTPTDERTMLITPAVLLLKSRSFMAALLMLLVGVLCTQIEGLRPFKTEIYSILIAIVGLVFFKDGAENVAKTLADARTAIIAVQGDDELVANVYAEFDKYLRDVLFGGATTTPSEVKQIIAQGVAKTPPA